MKIVVKAASKRDGPDNLKPYSHLNGFKTESKKRYFAPTSSSGAA